MEIVSLKNVSFTYPKSDKNAVKDISLKINEGEFIVLCGKSGSGKTTLQTLIKPELSPKGRCSGEIELFGVKKEEVSPYESASGIGFIRQNTEYQIVTHTVRSELAFGIENLRLSVAEMNRRIAETAEYFSLSKSLDRRCDELSGGEKQLLCLASVCAMHPRLLILDEPTAQLDPVTSERLIFILRRLCDDFSVSVLLSEHRLETVIPISDRVIALDEGEIVFDGKPSEMARFINEKNDFLFKAMPLQARICSFLGADKMPVTIAEGRKFLNERFKTTGEKAAIHREDVFNVENVIVAKHIDFSYDAAEYVLKDFSVNVRKGEIFALMGENGSGKTTALKLLSGLMKSRRGKIGIFGKDIRSYDNSLYSRIAVLPQKVETLFAGPTVFDDLNLAVKRLKLEKRSEKELIERTAAEFSVLEILGSHPYDISGGQMQKAALAMAMLPEPDILFLDEPTKGMDVLFKNELSSMLKELKKSGKTVFMVCHDAEFIAETADRVALLFDGKISATEKTREFFAGNYFYTTAAAKLSRGIFEGITTEEELRLICEKNF